jgi:hypothetical protein
MIHYKADKDLSPFLEELEGFILKNELTHGDVFLFSCIYAVFAADQMDMSRSDFLYNAVNFWDMYSKKSSSYHQTDMQ